VKAANRILGIAGDIANPLFILGDFNSTPSTFPHAQPTADGSTSFDVLLAADRFNTFPATDVVPRPGDGLFTFPSTQAVRTIDWVLLPRDWRISDGRVMQCDFSDHLPVFVNVYPAGADDVLDSKS
jgi:endonuclease/exonuclease/phosphatase family metal-dependent hydrolase